MNRKQVLIGIGVLVVIVVLAAASFVGAQLISNPEQAEGRIADAAARGGNVMEIVSNDGSGARAVRVIIEPSSDLPNTGADEQGIFERRSDNSIFIRTGNVEVDVVLDETGKQSFNASGDGPEIEIVFTRDTKIFEDITDMSQVEKSTNGDDVTIQQEIAPVDSIEVVSKNFELQVWGEKRGDRLSANIVVFKDLSQNF